MKRLVRAILIAAVASAPLAAPAQNGPNPNPSGSAGGENLDPSARSSMAQKRKSIANLARRRVRSLFDRLCPGRCELVDLSVEMKDPKVVGGVQPGFEGGPGQAYDMEPKSITVSMVLDSKLPGNFQQNLPRMVSYQLHGLAPEIRLRKESFAFPKPQNRPSPPPQRRRRPRMPRKMERPEDPDRDEEDETASKKKKKDNEKSAEDAAASEETDEAEQPPGFWGAVWQFLEKIAPWAGPILLVLVLGLLALAMMRRYQQLRRRIGLGAAGATDSSEDETPPSADELRAELTESRALKNRVLRKWLREDPEGVAQLVRYVGPTILDDLKSSDELDDELEEVSDRVAEQQRPLSDDEIERIANETHARVNSARVRHAESELDAEWEFLEGLDRSTLRRVLESCDTREKLHVVGKLPQTLRGAYLESLDTGERRELFLASDSGELDKQESRTLAGRLRQAADQYRHVGAEAEGRAALVVDMLESLELDEQHESLRELYETRPEVARAVLSDFCLESACTELPKGALADAIHRTPLDTLTNFLRGTTEGVRERVLEVAPRQKREDLHTELSLEVPASKSEYLSAREQFMDVVKESVRKEGYDLLEANRSALRNAGDSTSQGSEVAE